MDNVWTYFLSWIPPILYYSFLAMVVFVVVILVIKIVAFVINAIPFL